MIKYLFIALSLFTVFVFLECYAHELIYEDGAYKIPFEFLGFIWAAYIFSYFVRGVLFD